MSFLPTDYKSPIGNSNYFKLHDGENKVRILSAPILGWEDWEDKKPLRFPMSQKPEKSIDPKKPMKHFWAMVVWDYAQQKICLWEITQNSIRKKIESLSKDSDWGSPFGYDLKVLKTGSQMKTDYEVNPVGKRDLDPKIKDAFYETPIYLHELFNGGDPFDGSGTPTLPFWAKDSQTSISQPPISEALITSEQAEKIESEIRNWIDAGDRTWRGNALNALKISTFRDLPARLYQSMMKRIEEKKASFIDEELPF